MVAIINIYKNEKEGLNMTLICCERWVFRVSRERRRTGSLGASEGTLRRDP